MWAVAGLAGLVMVGITIYALRGWLGLRHLQTTAEPQCAKCGYLTLGNDTGLCTECGHDLSGSGTVQGEQVGIVRRKWMTLFILSLAISIGLLWAGWSAGQRWREFLPMSSLYARLAAGDQQAGWVLSRRFVGWRENGMPISQDDMLAANIDRETFEQLTPAILELQGDRTKTWRLEFGTLFEWGRRQGWASEEMSQQYDLQRFPMRFKVRSSALGGTEVPLTIDFANILRVGESQRSNISSQYFSDHRYRHIVDVRRYRLGDADWTTDPDFTPTVKLHWARRFSSWASGDTSFETDHNRTLATPVIDETLDTTLYLEVVTRIYDTEKKEVTTESVEVQELPITLTDDDSDIYFGDLIEPKAMIDTIEIVPNAQVPPSAEWQKRLDESIRLEITNPPVAIAGEARLLLGEQFLDAGEIVANSVFNGSVSLPVDPLLVEQAVASGQAFTIEIVPKTAMARELIVPGPFYPDVLKFDVSANTVQAAQAASGVVRGQPGGVPNATLNR